MKLLNKLFKRDGIIRNRKVTKARFLYLYVISGAIGGFIYFVLALSFGWPKSLALMPLYGLVGFIIGRFAWENWKSIWMYISDKDQGRLMMFLNNSTEWTEEQKVNVVNWTYLRSCYLIHTKGRDVSFRGRNLIHIREHDWIRYRKRTVRKETFAKISEKARTNIALTDEEKMNYGFESVFCPQQVLLGFNKALLVHALIYAHENIEILDDELREIMELTDDHISSFNILRERKKAGGDEYDKYMEIGAKASEKLK